MVVDQTRQWAAPGLRSRDPALILAGSLLVAGGGGGGGAGAGTGGRLRQFINQTTNRSSAA